MQIMDMLDELQRRALDDERLKARLLAVKEQKEPLFAFCGVCRDYGYQVYPMDVINVGEEFYASMRRSTNGGGENSPMLDGEDDFFELFLAALER